MHDPLTPVDLDEPAFDAQPDLLWGIDKSARKVKPLRKAPSSRGLLICGVDEAEAMPKASASVWIFTARRSRVEALSFFESSRPRIGFFGCSTTAAA